MNNLSVDDYFIIAKIFAHVMGNTSITLSEADKEAAKSLIKKMVDQRLDWSPVQREQFKLFAETVVK